MRETNIIQPADVKSVAIIRAGNIGHAMAQIAPRPGRPVMIADIQGPPSR